MISATVLAIEAELMSRGRECGGGRACAVAGRPRGDMVRSEGSRTAGEEALMRAEDGRGGRAAQAAALADAGNCKGYKDGV